MFQSLSGSVTTPMPLMYSTQASSTAASALLTATAPLTVTPLTKAQKDSMFLWFNRIYLRNKQLILLIT